MARKPPDFISMACTSASVCYREVLTKDELLDALTSGRVPRNRFAHFRMLLEEAPEQLLLGLVEQASLTDDRSVIEANLLRIAEEVETPDRIGRILRENSR